jgi:eukaryotic-like serine/threonine-protein kinase
VAEEIIGGYRVLKVMATGLTSQVYEVVELKSQRHFAMKLLLPEKEQNPEHRRMLLHEGMVGVKLQHPNVIKIVTFSKDPKVPYFVMEYFPAGSLKDRMLKKQFDFIKQNASSIFKQTATALAYMHASGWLHRDIKPDNILVNSAGDLRVIDFAIAKRIDKPSFFSKLFRRKGAVQGTRSYMSPEQIRGQPLDGRADMYSYAATLYELTTGRPPFRGATSQDLLNKHIAEKPVTPQMHNPDLTDEFCQLVLQMLAKKRDDRPHDFHQVLMKLRGMKIYKSEVAQKRSEE